MEKAFYSCVWKLNINGLPDLIKRAAELKVDEVSVFFARFYPTTGYRDGRGLNSKDSLFFHKALYNKVIRKSKKIAQALSVRLSYQPLFFGNFDEIPCCQPWHLVVVDSNGNAYPCCGGEDWFYEKVKSGMYNFGNLLREDVKDFWNNETYILLRRTCSPVYKDKFISECENCHSAICLKGADVEGGHILRISSRKKNVPKGFKRSEDI